MNYRQEMLLFKALLISYVLVISVIFVMAGLDIAGMLTCHN